MYTWEKFLHPLYKKSGVHVWTELFGQWERSRRRRQGSFLECALLLQINKTLQELWETAPVQEKKQSWRNSCVETMQLFLSLVPILKAHLLEKKLGNMPFEHIGKIKSRYGVDNCRHMSCKTPKTVYTH